MGSFCSFDFGTIWLMVMGRRSRLDSWCYQSCPRVGWTRGSGRVTVLQDFGGSGQHFEFFSFLLIISWYLNRCESSNTTFGLIDFLRYLI